MLKNYEVLISGKAPYSKTIQALSLQDAYNKVKSSVVTQEAQWDMYPVFEGEKRVTTYFKCPEFPKSRVTIFNPEFRGK